jgi:hypothetical protein
VVGQITKQQARVFAMFAAAFLMTGLAFSFSAMGHVGVALAAAMTTLAFIFAMVLETQDT